MKTRLGRQESLLLAYAQMRNLRLIRTGDLRGPLRLSPQQEREVFRRLARGKMIARVRPGVYLVPPRLPLGGAWTPDEALALNGLLEDAGGRYQICGPNAFNRYGFDEQIPTRVYAYNNRLSGDRQVGAVELTLIKVADERLGDIEEVQTAEGETAVYCSRARTLVDAVYDWARFNSLPRGYQWIRVEMAAKRVTAAELVKLTLRYGDMGTIRRLGLALQRASVEEKLLKRLERALRPSTSLIPWIPGRPKRGAANRRWGVVENDTDAEPA